MVRIGYRCIVCLSLAILLASASGVRADKFLSVRKTSGTTETEHGFSKRRCLTPQGNDEKLGGPRTAPWKLPTAAMADYDTTIHCLVLRFDFLTDNDPNTTGNGRMNLSREYPDLYDSIWNTVFPSTPIVGTDPEVRRRTDSIWIERHDHYIDPPPHDSTYFGQHMRSLSRYWEVVSEGRIDSLTWDIYPKDRDAVFQLPNPMSRYGQCDQSQVNDSLFQFVRDCIALADTSSVWGDIDFALYDVVVLFHAGSDQQNNIGFPETCADLYTGFVRLGYDSAAGWDDRILVNDSVYLDKFILMPETASQDGRVTALNAVMAHEFGHFLGLIDLYSTEPGRWNTQLGDFALMDYNGFGSGIEFAGFPNVLKVFGTMPVYPTAWSRAFLGFIEVTDIRSDTIGVTVLAAEVGGTGAKAIRVPITEDEYYLIENRIPDVDDKPTGVRFEYWSSVIIGPSDEDKNLTSEYDILMPGEGDVAGGMLIYHVDEQVGYQDYTGNGVINFYNNHLQWWRNERRFMTLVEADGVTAFGGSYPSNGFGEPEDMFRDDRNNAFTPNTNPPAIDNSGNNTHVHITNIRRGVHKGSVDSTMLFDLDFDDWKADGFPQRLGRPYFGLAPIADNLDGDSAGTVEIIAAVGYRVLAMMSTGEDFLRTVDPCSPVPCEPWEDTVGLRYPSIRPDLIMSIDTVPVYIETPDRQLITAGPVTGRFDLDTASKLIAIGYHHEVSSDGVVALYNPEDSNDDGLADLASAQRLLTQGDPIALSFGDSILYAVTDANFAYRQLAPGLLAEKFELASELVFGICRLDDYLVVLAGDSTVGASSTTQIHLISDTVHTMSLEGTYLLGPIAVDVNQDGNLEVVAFSIDSCGVYVTVTMSGTEPTFEILTQRCLGEMLTTNPIATDVDLDGRPDIVIGGQNRLLAYDANLTTKTDFPREVDDRYPEYTIIAPPISADIEAGGLAELVFATDAGNFYSYGASESFGFPLTSGEMHRAVASSAVYFSDSTGAKLGYVGGDGWFYAWNVDVDRQTNFWPMSGADPGGSFRFDATRLVATNSVSGLLPEEKFFNYPNPTINGTTTIRYYLGEEAQAVALSIYDLSGQQIAQLDGSVAGEQDNEVSWDCSSITPGVYRCVIKAEFNSETITAFTDIAVIR